MNYNQLVTELQSYTENVFSTADINTFITQAEQRIYNSVQFPSLRKNVTGTVTANNKYLSAPDDFLSSFSLAAYLTASTTATGTSSAFTIVVASATNIEVGQYVSGSGIGTKAIVTIISGTTITLSVANSGAVAGAVAFQGSYSFLLNKDVNFMRESFPNPSDTGQPQYYALFGPNSTYPAELSFILGPTPDATYTVELHYFYYPESIVTASTSWVGDNFESALLYGSLREAVIFQKGEQDMVAYYEKMYMESLGLLKNLGDGKLRRDAYRSGQIRLPVK
jgi:hypothetical protein